MLGRSGLWCGPVAGDAGGGHTQLHQLECMPLAARHPLPAPALSSRFDTANFDTMNHLLTEFDLRLAFQRISENLRAGGHSIFDLITPCQPLGGAHTYIRRLGSGSRKAAQHIRWDPWQKILSIFVVMDSPSSKVLTLEAHRERAYSPAEVGRWLMDGGFLIRAVHDAVTIRMATGCPQRIIVIARKKPV